MVKGSHLSPESRAKISATLRRKSNEISEHRRAFWDSMSKEQRSEYCKPFYSAGMAINVTGKQTSIELKVKEQLDSFGVEYEEQKEFGNGKYFVDFYIPMFNIVVECDGDYWHSLPNMKKRDEIRDKWFESMGIITIRIPEFAIKRDTKYIIKNLIRIFTVLRKVG